MRRKKDGGFTLLEIMLATSLLAIGSVSVLVVFATAAGLAAKRQGDQRLTQVIEEARSRAQQMVNDFEPSERASAPGDSDGRVEPQQSQAYGGYVYRLTFKPTNRAVPEAGYDVGIDIEYGDGLQYGETFVIGANVIPDHEFERSLTYERERAGLDSQEGGQE